MSIDTSELQIPQKDQESEPAIKVPEICSDDKYVRFYHACGSLEVALKILEAGLYCPEGEIKSTAAPLSSNLNDARQGLSTPHLNRRFGVIISFPKITYDRLRKSSLSGEIKNLSVGRFFLAEQLANVRSINRDGKNDKYKGDEVIDPRFIEGYYSLDYGVMNPNPKFVSRDQEEFVSSVIGKRIIDESEPKTVEEWWKRPEYKEEMGDMQPWERL